MKKEIFEKRTTAQRVVFVIVFVLFVVYAVSLLYPFIWSFYNSLKVDEVAYNKNSFALPSKVTFQNYAKVFTDFKCEGVGIFRMFLNSVLLVLLTTVFAVVGSSCAAYVVSKFKFFGSKFIYTAAVFIMVVPTAGLTPALYQILAKRELTNSIIVCSMIQGGCFGMYFMLMYGTFKTLSWTYAEAGYMDGANDFTIFFRIMMPQVWGQVFALSLVCAIGIWNDYYYPWVFMPKKPTISTGLYTYQTELIDSNDQNHPLYFATLLICCIPILIVFTCFQNTLMNNTSAGGIKG